MSTLERSKAYDAKLNPRQLGDKSAERVNNPTPHQAQQRERVSFSVRPRRRSSSPAGQQLSRRSSSPANAATWQDYISPDINMGVPTLLMLLEPNVVWRHAHGHTGRCNKAIEAASCQGRFFEGHDQLSKLAHGVYEGSYWQLLGDLAELEAMLAKLARAPSLMEEPTLQLPPEPQLPDWEVFKPELLPLPDKPVLAAAPVLPPFVEPDLPTSVDLPPLDLLPVPALPPPWREVVAPSFTPPSVPQSESLQLPELKLPNALIVKEPMKPPPNDPPKYGHDWSGKRPFTVPEPAYVAPSLPPPPEEILPEVPPPELKSAQLNLKPEPLIVLAWHGGFVDADEQNQQLCPEPQQQPILQQQQQQDLLPLQPADSPQQLQAEQQVASVNANRPLSAAGKTKPSRVTISAGGANSNPGTSKQSTQCVTSSTTGGSPLKQQEQTLEQLQVAWQEVEDAPMVDSGSPFIWLAFQPPFAEPPPVFLPPKPEPGPEPQLLLPTDLQEPPVYVPPIPQAMPVFVEPPLVLPKWCAPCKPMPIGFLRGTAPVLIMDVSGTMHPARRGQFVRVKKCVCELLEPDGELSTAGTAFDVLAFSGACWSFSAAWAGKRSLLDSALSKYSTARQAGGKSAGQLLPQTTAVARSRAHQHQQQLQWKWQQQAQRQQLCRPATAPTQGCGSTTAFADDTVGSDDENEPLDDGKSKAKQQMQMIQRWQQQQQLAISRPSTAVPHASNAAAEETARPTPRNRRPGTADPAAQATQPGSTRQQQQACQQDTAAAYGPVLQPTDVEHLTEAQLWVRNWPEAVGNTKLLTALMQAHQYRSSIAYNCVGQGTGQDDTVDCYYLFSDGLADDAAACLEWVQQQANAGQPMRPVHTVGFFPRNGCASGERFLSQLAAATGGTYQVYNADLPAHAIIRNAAAGISQNSAGSADSGTGTSTAGVPKVWDSMQGKFVAYDLANEDSTTRDERLWAEQQLKQLRRANQRSGKMQSLAAMLETLRQQHQAHRALPAMAAHEAHVRQLRAAHSAACATVQRANEMAVRQAMRNHAATVQNIKEDNERKVNAAHQAYATAVEQWQRQYKEALAAWEAAVAEAEAVAKAASAAAETAKLAAAAVAQQKQQQHLQEEQHQQPAQDLSSCSELAEASDLVLCSNSASGLDSGLNVHSDSVTLPANASSGVYEHQAADMVSANTSLGSFIIASDPSLGPDPEASLLNMNNTSQPAAMLLHSASASVVDLTSDAASAKLVFPLPAMHDPPSRSSVTGWGGTPRLPDATLVQPAAGTAATMSAAVPLSVNVGGAAVPASEAKQSSCRPKSASARCNSAGGNSSTAKRHLGIGRSSTDNGSGAQQHVAAIRPASAGGQVTSTLQSKSASQRRSSTSRIASAGVGSSMPGSRPISASAAGAVGRGSTASLRRSSTAALTDVVGSHAGCSEPGSHPVSASAAGAAKSTCPSVSRRASTAALASKSDSSGSGSAPGLRPVSASAAGATDRGCIRRIRRASTGVASKSSSGGGGGSLSGARCSSGKPRLRGHSTDRGGSAAAGLTSLDFSQVASSNSGAAAGESLDALLSATGGSLQDAAMAQQAENAQRPTLSKEEALVSHILAIEEANKDALGAIYEAWHEQIAEAEQHNTEAIALHEQASQEHAEKLAAYLQQKQVWEEQVQQLEAAAKQVYDQALAQAAAESARLAELHEQEVQKKLAKDRVYAQALADHAAHQASLQQQHEAAVAAAKAEHAAAVAAAKELWQQQQVQLEQSYQRQLGEAQQQHADMVLQIKEQNRLAREAHRQASEVHRAATVKNKRRIALAQEQQALAEAKLIADNEAALKQARQDYKALCQQLEEAHQQLKVARHQDWLAAQAAVQERNDEAIAAARARYAAAVEEAMRLHQASCELLRKQHSAELALIRARNEEIMPQVQLARIALTELARVKIFAAHIRSCAAKMAMGVNFVPDTPNLNRVVEMSALTDGLKAAFPEIQEPKDYPWPVMQRQLQYQHEGHPQQHSVVSTHQQLWHREGNSSRFASKRQQQCTDSPNVMDNCSSRPSTAPCSSTCQGSCATTAVPAVNNAANLDSSIMQGTWRAKSPDKHGLTPADLENAMRQLQQQVQRPQSSCSNIRGPWQASLSLSGSGARQGDISSRSCRTPSLYGQQSMQHQPHSSSPKQHSRGWGRHTGKSRQDAGQFTPMKHAQLQPGMLIAGAVPAVKQVALQQRPSTAPVQAVSGDLGSTSLQWNFSRKRMGLDSMQMHGRAASLGAACNTSSQA